MDLAIESQCLHEKAGSIIGVEVRQAILLRKADWTASDDDAVAALVEDLGHACHE